MKKKQYKFSAEFHTCETDQFWLANISIDKYFLKNDSLPDYCEKNKVLKVMSRWLQRFSVVQENVLLE